MLLTADRQFCTEVMLAKLRSITEIIRRDIVKGTNGQTKVRLQTEGFAQIVPVCSLPKAKL